MKSKAFDIPTMSIFRNILIMCFLAGGILVAKANSPEQEFTRNINREFGTTADGMTALYNKHGQVNVKTWQNNSVKIDITIVVNAGSQREADKVFDRIKVNFANAVGYVKAETMIEQFSGVTWFGGGGNDFKINYEVYMPVGNQLDLKNRYGNSYVAPLNGKLIAEIKYGDLRTETVNNDADLNLGYGKGYISSVKNLYGQVSYSELTINEAREIQLDTKYSELKGDRVSILRLTSKYDDFELGNVDELRLQTKYANLRVRSARAAFVTAQYTDIRFASVTETADADLSYGSLKIEQIGRNFTSVNVVGQYTDMQLHLERGTACRYELEGHYTDIKTPPGANVRSQHKSGSYEKAEGSVGDTNAKGLVKAKLKYGGLALK